MSDVLKEYYVLSTTKEILGVFETLEECLTWEFVKGHEEAQLVITRIKRLDSGKFRKQTIGWMRES